MMLRVRDLRFHHLSDGVRHEILKGITLDVEKGEFFTLLGTSGCGKSTALRCIAGLERPTDGTIAVDGATVVDAAADRFVPPHRRDLSMVFQSYAIWPHMTVAENVGFPLETQRLTAGDRRDRVRRALEMVGLAHVADRSATLLSGGQQQRVALARAFVRRSKLLLLDEPLSNLDARLRVEMRQEMKRLQQEAGVTTLYVTHDQEEALAMSDRIAVMHAGTIVEIGTPGDLYFHPAHHHTAEFLGRLTVLPVKVAVGAPVDVAETEFGPVRLAATPAVAPTAVAVRPEHVAIAPVAARPDGWRGRVATRTFSGRIVDYTVAVNGRMIPVQATSATVFDVGSEVALAVEPHNWIALTD